MKNELVTVRNTLNGQISYRVRRSIAEHEVLGKNLVIVDHDAKPYAQELYKPKSADEFTETKKTTAVPTRVDPGKKDEK